MRRVLRLSAILTVSLVLASILSATAWAVPARLRGRYRSEFLRAWSRAMCILLGIQVEVLGESPPQGPWLAVSNHLGYTDIPVLGSVLAGTFVSKSEVGRWPLIGFLSKQVGTLYCNRERRTAAGGFAREVAARVQAGERVLLFPEGTSTRGEGILRFKSAPFGAVAGMPGGTVLPLHVDVVEIGGEPAVGALRDKVCWHGDAAFAPHLYRLLSIRGIRYRVVVGTAIACSDLDRKTIASMAREQVGDLGGISARRQLLLPGEFIWVHPVV
jgi:1-acyl-sn-glycerol-3-phosphate acyltransferase